MSWIADLKNKINIVDFIRNDGVEIKSESGGRWSAKCPFHNEKTPSFKISEDYQNFNCFGCKEYGDVISYFAKRSLLGYMEAASILAEKYGIKVEGYDNKDHEKAKRFYSITRMLEDFYKENFNSLPDIHPAKKQITDRGLKISNDFGYCPFDNASILKFTDSHNISREDLKELGFINDNNNFILRNRLIFFIRNYMGETIGFTGRSLEKETGSWKYINSQTSLIYNKQLALYNIDEAKSVSRKKGYIFLVEGQFDVIAMKQAGHENVIAISGSAMSQLQLKEIEKCLPEHGKIILILDGDEAGQNASHKIFKEFPYIHERLMITTLPQGQDPCDFITSGGKFSKPVDMTKFLFETIKNRHNLNEISQRNEFINDIQENLTKYISNKVIKEQFIKNAASLAGVNFNNITIATATTKKTEVKSENKIANISKEDEYFMTAIATYISNKDILKAHFNTNDFPSKYHNFLIELINSKNTHFIPEEFTQEKLAKIIVNYSQDRIEDEDLVLSHYKTLIQKANELIDKNNQNNKITELINKSHDLSHEDFLKLLKESSY